MKKRYIWSPYSRVYHDRLSIGEVCNTDSLKHRREADEPPKGKALCKHCEADKAWEAQQ